MTNLNLLSIKGTWLSGPIPSQLGLLTRLVYLYLDECFQCGQIPSQIGRLTSLLHLLMEQMELSGPVPSEIGRLTGLEYLSLYDNQLTGTIPSQIYKLTRLTELQFGYNHLKGSLTSQLGLLTGVSRLVMYNNWFDGSIPSQLGRLKAMEFLHLDYNSFTGLIPTQFGNFDKLTIMVLGHNTLTGPIPSELGKLTLLKTLVLGSNKLSGTMPSQLGLATTLDGLVLYDNKLAGPIPSQFGKLTLMNRLSTRSNYLSGSIPTQLGLLTSLLFLDMSFNQLSGAYLPVTSQPLIYLVLHHNRLSGLIPSQIALLTNLKLLSLFDNRLHGSLPPLHQTPESLILLFDNLLSCSLPDGSGSGNRTTSRTLVALGNMFSLDGWNHRINAEWLYHWDADSTHLFVEFPLPWVRQLALLGCLAGLALSCYIVGRCAGGAYWHTHLDRLWMDCVRLGGAFSLLGVVYMGLLASSQTLHECVNPLAHVTLAETTRLERGLCGCIITFVVGHGVLSVLGLIWLSRGRYRASNLITPLLPQVPQDSPQPSEGWRGIAHKAFLLVLWMALICVLNIPTLLNFMAASFPANNTLGIGPNVVVALRWILSPLLVLISELIIPALSNFVVNRYFPEKKDHGIDTAARKSRHRRKKFELILTSQILVLAVAPILSQVLVHESCMRLTRSFWGPCQPQAGVEVFDVDVTLDTQPFWNWRVSVLTQEDVCGVQAFHLADAGLCVRGVVETTSRLNISKIVTQCLFLLLRTLIVFGPPPSWLPRSSLLRNWWNRLCRRLWVNQHTITQSIMSLTVVGFVYGGVAPLIWLSALIGVASSILVVWFLTGVQRGRNIHTTVQQMTQAEVPSWRPVWWGVAIQFTLMIWYLATASPCA
eukprot:c19360_g1_i2.p1 GENE.c19360_g1_i2~~c19360_g1_i2.p1  ORF type:complete len:875 (+),score=187.56 c19360_g1_i2:214-2838(+)